MILISLPLLIFGLQLTQAQTSGEFSVDSSTGELQFSQDNNLAFLEAIEFCLDQLGSPVRFDGQTRKTMLEKTRQAFPALPLEIQFRLAHAREILTIYQATWDVIDIDEKKAFAFDILSLAFGEAAAKQALGISDTPTEKSYDEVVDDFCVHNPGVCP